VRDRKAAPPAAWLGRFERRFNSALAYGMVDEISRELRMSEVTPVSFPNPFDDHAGAVKSRVAAFYVLLVCANAAAWIWAFVAFADRPVLIGAAFLAYVFGLRTPSTQNHYAAIDNAVRKLMQEGKRPSRRLLFLAWTFDHCRAGSAPSPPPPQPCKTDWRIFKAVSGTFGTLVSACFCSRSASSISSSSRNLGGVSARPQRREHRRGGARCAPFRTRIFTVCCGSAARRNAILAFIPDRLLFGLGFDTATRLAFSAYRPRSGAGMSFWTI